MAERKAQCHIGIHSNGDAITNNAVLLDSCVAVTIGTGGVQSCYMEPRDPARLREWATVLRMLAYQIEHIAEKLEVS